MAKTIDLRTYLLLERAFVRRLQRSWRQQSAPTYAKITQACLDHQWDKARQYVTDLDMAEVGTENREWITYMLLSCAVFGANTVAKGKPSFVGVGTFDTFLKQVTNNFLQYLEFGATAQVQAEALQSIAEDEAKTKAPKVAFDPNQPRDAHGRFTDLGLHGGLVTVLHGTTRQNAEAILKEGFKAGNPASVAAQIEAEYALPKGSILNHVAFQFAKGRTDLEEVHFTTDESVADQYSVPEVLQDALTSAHMLLHPTPEDEPFTKEKHAARKAWIDREAKRLTEPALLAVTVPFETVGQHSFGRKLTLTEFQEIQARFPKAEDWFNNIRIPLTALGGATIQRRKWDEAKHPRDKEGQFTEAAAGRKARPIPQEALGLEEGQRPEGAGPAYDDYKRLYQATLDTSEAFQQAKALHRVNVDKALQQLEEATLAHPDEDLSQLEARVYGAPEYLKTKLAAQRAQQIFNETIDEYQVKLVAMKREIVTNLATSVATELGVDPSLIHVVDKEPPEFTVGNKKFKEAGHFNPRTGQIEINVRNLAYDDAALVKGIAAHELSHVMYKALHDAMQEEYDRFHDKAGYDESHTPWFHEHFTQQHMYGKEEVKPGHLAAVQQEFPALAVASVLSGHIPSMGVSEEMKQENGHSAYAKSYWAPEAVQARGTYETAVNETTAELTRYLTNPQSWNEKDKPDPTSPWMTFTKAMHQWYTEGNELRRAGAARVRAT